MTKMRNFDFENGSTAAFEQPAPGGECCAATQWVKSCIYIIHLQNIRISKIFSCRLLKKKKTRNETR
jgi:hypothetical protein